jgi:membrane fusion protein (multidrug efflux system)
MPPVASPPFRAICALQHDSKAPPQMTIAETPARLAAALLFASLTAFPAHAQFGPAGPPAVGVQAVGKQAVVESSEFVGRVQATDRVDIVARVTAFIEERGFTEGAEVQKGDLLYRLERAPFEADVGAKAAGIAQTEALLKNAIITLKRAQSLIASPAGRVADVDAAVAQQASYVAQMQAGQAQLRAAEINLAYTEIRAPIAGRVGRSALAVGNVVTPSSGPLVSIVSQDPMYVTFPIAVRSAIELRNRYADRGGFTAVQVKIRLPDGRLYPEAGILDYADPSVSASTDTIMLRARIANKLRPGTKPDDPGARELIDGEFVTVMVEGTEPLQALAIPRAAVLSDQQGSYVYVLDAEKKVEQRRIQLGQSTPSMAIIASGLKEGEQIVVDGLQRVRPGIVVNPAPATAAPAAPPRT